MTHPEERTSPSAWSLARIPAGLLARLFLMSWWAYVQLPGQVTMRTLFSGRQVSTESAVQFAFALPCITALIVAFSLVGVRWNMVVWPRIPIKASDADAMRPLVAYNFSVVVAMSGLIHAFGLGAGLRWLTEATALRGAGISFGIGFMLLGNVLPLVTRPNAFIGYRASVLYDDPVRWSNTQRVAGYVYVMVGLVLAGGFALNPLGFTRMIMPLIAIAIIAPLLLARTKVPGTATRA